MTYTLGSTSGKWSAFIEPLTTRTQIFHLVKAEPTRVVDSKVIDAESYEVELKLNKLEWEGDWGPAPPTMKSNFSDNELSDFLQCIVDEASKIGIVARGYKDTTSEIKRIEYHLEDMRKLVFREVKP